MRKLLTLILLTLLLMACANMGTPDGGAYDETPPRIVGTSPRYGSVNSKAKKVVLLFDENVKLDNPMEKVVISPPQINQPDIDATGKKITIQLNDTLKPGITYTIDFADAIQDNNEGNPMDDYAFTFSTGETVDTFQVSGYVLDASDLEPIKGILVGLYRIGDDEEDIPDSLFTTHEFERVSRTNSSGHFVIKGLDEKARYRVFALKDQDQDFTFSQKAEMIGFNHRIITPSAKPDVRQDTVWHDSIHYDSIIYTPYTHFYPDDIVITAFLEEGQNRALLKRERLQMEKFTLYFTAPDSTLPVIRGINFNEENAFVVEANERKDTIDYWVRDSMTYNNDTLKFYLTYNYTDTLGQLVERTDTVDLLSKLTYEKLQKRRQNEWDDYKKEYIKEYKQEQKRKRAEEKAKNGDNTAEEEEEDSGLMAEGENPPTEDEAGETTLESAEGKAAESADQKPAEKGKEQKKKKDKKQKGADKDEDIPIPPMPEKFLETKFSTTTINPDQNIDITFVEPIDTAYAELFHFYHTVDSVDYDLPFLLKRVAGTKLKYRFYAEWEPDSSYTLRIDTGAVVSMYGKRMAGTKKTIKVKGMDKFSQLTVNLKNAKENAIVSLINQSGKTVKRQKAEAGKADFFFVDPGIYYLSLFYDRNGDGKWTTGNYADQIQPEETYFFPAGLNLRAQWTISEDWNPEQLPLFKQKPEKITKQKPDKKKDRGSKNAERDKQKAKRK